MSIKVYEYQNCSTCKKALKYLDAKKANYQSVPIVDQPPSLAELKKMLSYLKTAGGSFKNLFNTSGVQYRELQIATKIKDGLTEAEALQLLSKNGKFIKRPFLLTSTNGTVGFKEDVWSKLLKEEK
jgi:arsenate reductase